MSILAFSEASIMGVEIIKNDTNIHFFSFLVSDFSYLCVCVAILSKSSVKHGEKAEMPTSVNLNCLCILKFYSQDYNSKPVGKL